MTVENRKYFFFSLTSGVLWGVSSPLIKITLEYLNEYDIAFFRALFSFFIVLLFNLLYFRSVSIKYMLLKWRSMVSYAFSGYVFFWILFNLGVKYSTAIEASFLVNFYIPITMLFSWIYYNNSFKWKEAFGVLSGLSGVYLVLARNSLFILNSASLLGDVFTLLSALSWAGYTVLIKYYKNNIKSEFSFQYQLFYATIFLLPIYLGTGLHFNSLLIPNVFILVILLTILSTILAFLLYIKSVVYLTPFQIGMTLISTPLTTSLISLVFLGETFTYLQYIGGALIIFSILFSYIE